MDKEQYDSNIYSAGDIQRYLDGEMSLQDMHALEKAALEDPFLADAIEGYAIDDTGGNRKNIAALKELLAKKEKPSKVIPFYKQPRYRVAAAVILLAGCMSLVYTLLLKNNDQRQLAVNKKQETSRSITADTVVTSLPVPAAVDTSVSTPEISAKSGNNRAASDNNPTPPVTNYYSTRETDKEDAVAKNELAKNTLPVPLPPVIRQATPRPAVGSENESLSFNKELEQKQLSGRVPGISVEKEKLKKKEYLKRGKAILKNDTADLAEVVVMGYGTQKRRDVTGSVSTIAQSPIRLDSIDTSEASPVTGVIAYREYLRKNIQRSLQETIIHGNVTVSFRVKRSGRLTGFKIIKSLSPVQDDEVIRLIKEGPEWKTAGNRKAKATVTVSF